MYLYENLGPEKFQEFCQALLLPEHPDLQCLPVGQPDGGRDALSRRGGGRLGSVVVQVKYKRTDERENADWMISALEGELPKVVKLAASGATSYIMMTNARGTAHPDAGRIDVVQAWLDEHFPIPAQVLWRDDLDRRVELSAPSLKLAYPSILTGNEVLVLLVEAQMGPERARIARALKAFIAEQFRQDKQIKFRQAELANSLLALFVDVPLHSSRLLWNRSGAEKVSDDLRAAIMKHTISVSPRLVAHETEGELWGPYMLAGTADLLLDSTVQSELPWVLLNGAPGQGKSTITQYVCQVHRARFLGDSDFLGQIDESHLVSGFRVPIKVDLRDFAEYLEGRSSYLTSARVSDGNASLERFLAALISSVSGGLEFTPDDVVSTLGGAPGLLFFDGLDEVGDLTLRRTVVDKTIEGLNRIVAQGSNLQVVVTSRPSLFGTAPALPKSFRRLDLAPIDRHTIRQYTRKWTLAKSLEADRAAEVTSILEEKLEYPHIAELTKNPMQLTILLSLILAKGHSLPDARTDLYREYVNLFMTREAEKTPMVREHQALLLAIVEFLAWRLQSEAEADGSAGSITEDGLRTIVSEYLDKGEQEPSILDDLFYSGIERVYVLVQRVEGLYEFEVQPLREYFAAKYLYSSAPVQSFRVDHVPGDRAQRFEAIARNPYWANVTRFYAGFYEDGELGALSTSLEELISSQDVASSINARAVGASLLTDWVFSNKKPIQREVVRLVFDSVGAQLAVQSRLAGFEGVLDKQCGRDALGSVLFDGLTTPDEQVEYPQCRLLSRNGGENFLAQFEEWCRVESADERTGRLKIALASGGFRNIAEKVLDELVFGDQPSEDNLRRRLEAVLRYGDYLLGRSAKCADAALNSILFWGGVRTTSQLTTLAALSDLLSPDSVTQWPAAEVPEDLEDAALSETGSLRIRTAIGSVIPGGKSFTRGESWDDPEAWDEHIESLRSVLGDAWPLYRMAASNIGFMRPSRERAIRDDEGSLLSIAQRARNFKGSPKWWREQIEVTAGDLRLYKLALLIAWAPSKHVVELLDFISDEVDNLGQSDFSRLLDVLSGAFDNRRARGGRLRSEITVPESAGPRIVLAIFVAFGTLPISKPQAERLESSAISARIHADELRTTLRTFPGWGQVRSKPSINKWLEVFRRVQLSAAWRDFVVHFGRDMPDMTVKAAEQILLNASEYPASLVAVANTAVQQNYAPDSVRKVAQKEKWVFA